MIGRTLNPVLLDRALFTFLDERLETHARDLRAEGATKDTIARGVECYRSQLLAQLLKIVIKNGPEWFGSDDWRTALEALPDIGVTHSCQLPRSPRRYRSSGHAPLFDN